MRVAKWIFMSITGLVIIVLIAAWLLLSSSMFSNLRRDIIQTALSEQIGQPLIINDDVRISIARMATIYLGGVIIPSENIENVELAKLETASFKLDLIGLLYGKFNINDLDISKLHVNLITKDNRTTSWSEKDTPPSKESEDSQSESDVTLDSVVESDPGIFRFLSDKSVDFKDIRLTVSNKWTGFEFAFILEQLLLEQLEGGAIVSLSSNGTVNEQDFAINGTFPRAAEFVTKATIGGSVLDITGTPYPKEKGPGFTAAAVFDSGSIGDLLEGLGLKRSVDGVGILNVNLTGHPGTLAISGLDTKIEFEKGQSFTITGKIDNVLKMAGVNVEFKTRLQPADTVLAKATSLKETKVAEINGRLASVDDGLELVDLHIITNSFQPKFRNLGPVSVGRFFRTKDGELSLLDVKLQVGPLAAPYVKAEGDIRDIFGLKGIAFDGELAASADILLKGLDPKRVAEFGSVKAEFSVSDKSGDMSLTHFKGYSHGSDLWSLNAELSVADLAKLSDLDFTFDLDVSDGARFLGALNMKPINTGAISFAGQIKGNGLDIATEAKVNIANSRIDATLSSKEVNEEFVVRGGMKSAQIDITSLRNVVAAAVQLQSFFSKSKNAKPKGEIKPLVIETKPKEKQVKAKDKPKIRPLVLKEPATDVKLVSGKKLMDRLDLEFGIHIAKIIGQEGISAIHSDLVLKDNKLKAGPIEVTYGGGSFKADVAMDLKNKPGIARITGSTSGWDFGKILDSVGLGIEAHGNLNGTFDIAGNISSAKKFMNSMTGNAKITMKDGNIATSLLDLSGLGVFKWLFSEELRQGYTDIVCVSAPVSVKSGGVSTEAIVIETKTIQMVVRGQVNWLDDTISIRAEPRPVGKPLHRSAFPFEVNGKLSKPKFKLIMLGIPPKRGAWLSTKSKPQPARVPCVADGTEPTNFEAAK